jgi:dipeptidyl aminopeptidase/acylaminoacyl peptidase
VFLDVEWSEDSETLSFVSSSRDHKIAQLQIANPETGEVRPVYLEEVDTYYESGYNAVNWRVFPERNEFVWFSEQENWGHLYLHDLQSGELKHQITQGSWAVLQIQQIDIENQQIYFLGSNREPGDPYFQYLYRVNFDGSELTNLTPETANHQISWSESAKYFSDVYSTPNTAPVSVVRNTAGETQLILEETDIDLLINSGWVAPNPFIVKARDQITDLYGLLYKPSNFDETKSYPILNYLYPGPQSGSVGTRSFRASRNDKQSLAELGFIVVELDAMGTPGRSKSFHDAYYADMGDNGLPDQIEGIRQLGAGNPWMDLERIGIWGHSGGGFASTAGILRYPDFYKVAVSGAGNHDNRNYEDDWGEKWQGLLETYPESNPDEGEPVVTTNYDNQANQLLAANLEGKLLLAHGMLDTNVHPSSTLLVVDALIEADKDFDLVVLPNASHGFGNRRYFMKRRWDYFVENLRGQQPPSKFIFADNVR